VLNFLGDEAFRTPRKNDVAMARWLIANRTRVKEAGEELKAAHGARVEKSDLDTQKLAANDSVSPEDVASMIESGPFFQILNDLNRFVEGKAPPSETVRFILAQSEIGPDSRILDAGCSAGRHLWELADRQPGLLVGLDVHLLGLAVGALAWQAQGMPSPPRWCCGSALQLPFRDSSFTQVNTLVTLSYVPVRAAVAELWRVLAPGGRLIVTVEGLGLWRKYWDEAPRFGRQRVQLLRWWLASKLLGWGLDWQRNRFTRRLSGFTQYAPKTIRGVVERARFAVERCEAIREYRGRAALIALSARKPDAEGPPSADVKQEAQLASR
jgi:SAM-dependent methyltransferase